MLLYFPGLVISYAIEHDIQRDMYLFYIDIFYLSFFSFEMPTKLGQDSEREFGWFIKCDTVKTKMPSKCQDSERR